MLWIRNTVAEAQAAMKQLRSDRCGETPELAMLHSRFPLFRREKLERFCSTDLVRTRVADRMAVFLLRRKLSSKAWTLTVTSS